MLCGWPASAVAVAALTWFAVVSVGAEEHAARGALRSSARMEEGRTRGKTVLDA
jgi:hypothetical protein